MSNLFSDPHLLYVEDYNDKRLSAEILFVKRYNKFCHSLYRKFRTDTSVLLKYIKEKYELTDKNIIHLSSWVLETTDYLNMKIEEDEFSDFDSNDTLMIDEPNPVFAIFDFEPEVFLVIKGDTVEFLYGDLSKSKHLEKILRDLPNEPVYIAKKHRFYMVYRTPMGTLELKEFRVKDVDVSIQEHYNDDFEEVDREIKEFLTDKNRDGIILLHGAVGTGKTTYIRHLMHSLEKRFIFFPPSLLYNLSSPDLIEFMSDLRDSILILEDCEDLIRPRGSGHGSNEALINLLNLGDGLLADALELKIICTFNADVDKVDPAIVRKGRLAVEYEFYPLKEDKVRKLVEKYNLDIEVNAPMTLAEIYSKNQIRKRVKHQKTLGFNKK